MRERDRDDVATVRSKHDADRNVVAASRELRVVRGERGSESWLRRRLARDDVRRVSDAIGVWTEKGEWRPEKRERVYVEVLDADGRGAETDRGRRGRSGREDVFVRMRRRREDGFVLQVPAEDEDRYASITGHGVEWTVEIQN